MLSFPYLGEKNTMMMTEEAMTTLPKARNPGARNRRLKADIVLADCCSGAFNYCEAS